MILQRKRDFYSLRLSGKKILLTYYFTSNFAEKKLASVTPSTRP